MICVSNIIKNYATLDWWSVYLTLYRMKTCRTRDLCIWHYTEWLHVGLVICVSDILQNDAMWTRDLCICHYTEWQHEITSPTWRHSVKCQIHRSRVQHVVILYNGRYTDHESIIILYNVRYTDHKSNMPSICIMSDTQITSPTWSHSVCQIHLDSWSVYLPLYRMTTCGLVICVSAIIQNDNMRSRVQHVVILYNGRYTDHESNMLSFCIMADTQITSPSSFCIMSDTQITSPTCLHSVLCQIHRSRVQHVVILYNVRYTDHKSNMPSFCIMSDTQITSPTWCHSV